MKSLILLIFLMVSTINGYSQVTTPQSKIEGIGPFKINKTSVSVIDDLIKNEGYKLNIIKKYDMFSALYPRDYKLINEICYDTTSSQVIQEPALNVKNVKFFRFSEYIIAGITISRISLTFQDDILISFESDASSDLEEALKLKYGVPTKKIDEKEVTCIYKLTGNTEKNTDKTYTSLWKNGNITAKITTMFYHDSQCKEQYVSILKLGDEVIKRKIDLMSIDNDDKKEEKQKAEKFKDIKSL